MTRFTVLSDKLPDLEGMQALVGGLIEPVYGPNGELVCIANEEALCCAEPVLNDAASRLACRPIFGDVFVLKGNALKEWERD